MNRRPLLSLLPVLLVLGTSGLSLMPSPANAQVGLRYGPLTSSPADTSTPTPQKTETPRLKLKLSAVGGTGNNAHVAGPTYAMPAYGASEESAQYSYNNLPASTRNMAMWADWRPFDNGLYTSAGWMWRNTLGDANAPINSNDSNRLSAPFLGLGYQGVIDSGSNWKWSAEVGAYAVGNRNCYNSVLSCSMSSGMGLKPSSNNDEVRWTPYFSLGASYAY